MRFLATYRIGGGPAGNVGADVIAHLALRAGPTPDLQVIRNPLPAQGGASPEPLAEARLLGPALFHSELQRAIVPADYARIVERDFAGQVQRAAASLNWIGSWYEVLVAVDPVGGEADPRLLEAIGAHLERYRRIGHTLQVRQANRVPLDIELSVCVLPSFLRGHVRAALADLFSSRALPDGRRGLFHPDNLTFGQGVAAARLVAAAHKVPGVESARVTRLQRRFEEPRDELERGIVPLGPLEVAQVDNDPSFPEHGRIELKLEGGR
jgi:predicted phage baseplate assembly protein